LTEKPDRLSSLTDAERGALDLLGQGYDIKACATALGISNHAVNERLRGARRKLGVTSSRAAAVMLRQNGDVPYKLSGDRFPGVVNDIGPAADTAPPAWQAEAHSAAIQPSEVREYQLAYGQVGEARSILPYVPLRGTGAQGNTLSKTERLQATIDLSIKIAAIAALVCLLALAINMGAQA
jgi:DNA-binding CsgD family transcriptional regulator